MGNLEKIKNLIEKKDLFIILIILFFSIISTFLELISISILIPFFSKLDSGLEFKNDFLIELNNFYNQNFSSELSVILLIIILVFAMKNTIFLFSKFIEQKFIFKFHAKITRKLFFFYLNKDFSFHTKNNSSQLIKNISSECGVFANNFLQPIILSIGEFIVLSVLLTFLFLLNFKTTIFILIFLVVISTIFNIFSKDYLRKLGKLRSIHSGNSFKELQQSFISIREIIIYKLHNFFTKKYDFHNKSNLATGYKSKFIYSIPKSLLEISAITGITLIIYHLHKNGTSFAEIVLTTSIYVLAATKIMPGITRIFSVLTNLNYTINSIKIFNKSFFSFYKNDFSNKIGNIQKRKKIYSLELKKIYFKYEKNFILNNLNLKIKSGEKIGIIGDSGSGKTTLINIMVGLLNNFKGDYIINNKKVNIPNLFLDQNLGYVPQNCLMIDDTIRENIELGREIKDKKKYIKIINDLGLKKLNSFKNSEKNKNIGERGAKISGGQNQRIGIARALIMNPSVLVLDEALNSIDNKIKKKIIDKIFTEYDDKIIIIVSHDVKDLKYCHKKYKLINGSLKRFF